MGMLAASHAAAVAQSKAAPRGPLSSVGASSGSASVEGPSAGQWQLPEGSHAMQQRQHQQQPDSLAAQQALKEHLRDLRHSVRVHAIGILSCLVRTQDGRQLLRRLESELALAVMHNDPYADALTMVLKWWP